MIPLASKNDNYHKIKNGEVNMGHIVGEWMTH